MEPKYSGPNCSGICICGHRWDKHHLGIVMRQEYIDETHEGYIPCECEAYGFNETGGLIYNPILGEWTEHCSCYVDTQYLQDIIDVIVDKLDNGDGSQIGDMLEDYTVDEANYIWKEVRRIRNKILKDSEGNYWEPAGHNGELVRTIGYK